MNFRAPNITRFAQIVSLCLLTGCASIQSQYEEVRKQDTIDAYHTFVLLHPDAPQSSLAKDRIEQISYEQAKRAGTSAGVEAFMRDFPRGHYYSEAAQLDVELSYREASSQNSLDAYEQFLARFPTSPRAKDAQKALDDLRIAIEESKYNAATTADTPEAYEQFLKEYPQGKVSSLATAHLRQSRLRKARAAPTSTAYEDFLKQYPDGTDSDELRQSLPVIKEFEKSMRLGQVCIEMAPKASNMLEVGVVSIGSRAVQVGKLEITQSPTFDSNLKELRQLLETGVAPDAVRISGYQRPSETTPDFDSGVQGLKIVSLGNPGTVVPSDRLGMTLLQYCKENGLKEACDLLEAHGAK